MSGTLLALDWGLKKIGVATGDSRGVVVTPRALWVRAPAGQTWSLSQADKADLTKLIETWEPELLILGDPRGSRGEITQASQLAMRHAERLKQFTGLDVHLVSETLTSWESRHEENEDSAAAALLIESFLRERKVIV
ncbi:MAG: Holliday junction resolvase RuvX [Bdellovibrionota bacterium]